MKPYLCLLLSLVFAAEATSRAATQEVQAATEGTREETAAGAGPSYVIPIKGMIERGLLYAIRRGLKEAEAKGAGALILDMDTPGGKLDSAEEIVQLLLAVSVPTYTFVNPRAISAGAIISLATDRIYMTPAGLIGDAMPILMSPVPFGGAQEVPEGLKEKVLSPTIALARSAAQAKGHDVRLAEAMIRPSFEYKIGDDVISPAGELLTLTSQEAERLVGEDAGKHPLLSSGTVPDLDGLLARIGRSDKPVIVIEITTAEKIARFIESLPVSGLLLALGLLGLYIEFKTPGFGFPGVAGILCLVIWFWGHHIAGLAGMGEMLVFLAGVMLLLVEIFLIPGFGVVGMAGITLMVVSVLMAMVQHYPMTPWYAPPAEQVRLSVINLGISLLLTFSAGAVLARFLPHTSVFRRITLEAAENREAGYSAPGEVPDVMGLKGVAATDLRPAGLGDFGDRRLNVVTRGNFVDKGTPIIVAEAHGNRIVVDPC